MANSKNPNNNSVLQALLDAKDAGIVGLDGAIAKISGDRKLQAALQKKWNSHAYPERDMVYVQMTITQALMELSPRACKVLIFMSCYCAQSTLIKVSLPVLETATGIKRTMLREALQELIDCGVVRVFQGPVRHDAPIYSIDPATANKGIRRKSKEQEYKARLAARGFCGKYLHSSYEPDLVVKCDTIKSKDDDGNPLYYNQISLIPVQKNASEPAPDTDPKAHTRKRRSPAKSTTAGPEEQIPGQMEMFMAGPDLEDFLPEKDA